MIATILWDFPNPHPCWWISIEVLLFDVHHLICLRPIWDAIRFKENVNPKLMDSLVYWMVGATIVGARLGHVFFYDWGYYKNHIGEILMVWKGGLASHGAAISIVLAMYWWSTRIAKKHTLWTMDRIVIVVALAGGFIRMGNWFNSEIYGAPANSAVETVFVEAGRTSLGGATDLTSNRSVLKKPKRYSKPIHLTILCSAQLRFFNLNDVQSEEYTSTYLSRILNASSKDNSNLLPYPGAKAEGFSDANGGYAEIKVLGVPRYPTQLFEAGAYWLIFVLLALLYLKTNVGARRGFLFGTFLICVFGFRFFIEFYKEIQVGFENSMSLNMGQWLSIRWYFQDFILMLTSKEQNS